MAKSVPSYLPLKLIYAFDEVDSQFGCMTGWRYKDLKPGLEKLAKTSLPDKKETFISDVAFAGMAAHKDEYTPQYVKTLISETLKTLASVNYNIEENIKTALTDAKDSLIYPIVVEKWSENKQVYKPDKIFIDALLQTRNFSLTRFDIEHLPTDTFFIDLGDVDKVKPYAGIFVDVIQFEDGVGVILYLITKELGVFSHYIHCRYEDDGGLRGAIKGLMDDKTHDDIGNRKELPVMGFDESTGFVKNEKVLTAEYTRLDMTRLVFQLLCYMSSKEPDIEESQISKSTYKKPQGAPQNRFSEVQTHDVGIRYGNSIRTLIRKENVRKKKKDTESKNTESISVIKTKKRKRPIPHFRCAHWQRFWTGKGRTEPVNKWIEPIFVGFGEQKFETDVIIHKME